MNIFFDGRVLAHKSFSGVENYAIYLYNELKVNTKLHLVQPESSNKYLQQLWEHFKLPRLVSKESLLFCPANIAPFILSKKIKLVLTLHDMAFQTFPKSVSKLFYLYYSFIVPLNIKRADKIITISEASKEEILKYHPQAKDKITVIPLGIDKKYRVLPEIKKRKQILYVGSINERKNLIGALEAFEQLPKYLGYTLVIVGNFFDNFTVSAKIRAVLQRAKQNDCIIFKQGLDDEALIYEYNVSTCLLFPSFYEGFGLPPLEAMACGTPVITSNISSMPEVCGDSAIYVNPADIRDITAKLTIVLEDDKKQVEMAKNGLEWVKQFTWEKAASKHMKVFQKVLEDKK